MSYNPRKLAVDIVYNVLKKCNTLSSELTAIRKRSDEISSLDIRFISEISTGVLRNLEYVDYMISKASDVKISKISPYVLCVLRCGCYQLVFMDKVPPRAAVDECVKLVKKSANRRLSGFVNAVMRKIDSQKNQVILPDDEIKKLSVVYSCPEWLVSKFKNRLHDETEQLLSVLNIKPATILRTNTLKTTRTELIDLLNSKGWNCTKYNSDLYIDMDYLITTDKVDSIDRSEEYLKGMFYIQDPAAAYVAEVMNPASGSVVFDMCASPGGKSTHIAEKMGDTGEVYSFDVSESKVNRIVENATRLGLKSIHAEVRDSTVNDPALHSKADYILVDAPCSGFGIIRKKPDIKYLRKETDSEQLAQISLSILCVAADYLKSGGTLVFSTCTILKEENEDVLFEFLKLRPDFQLKTIECSVKNEGYLTLFPHKNNCDGFFISLLIKE